MDDGAGLALLQRAYYGAWRSNLLPLNFPLIHAVDILPILLRHGGAGLLWPRIRHRCDVYGAAGKMLERNYQVYVDALQSIEGDIALIVTRMRASGIEPVLVKGWSLSSLYPAPLVRRPGDIDLIVPDESHAEAKQVIDQAYRNGLSTGVDLKSDDQWKSRSHADFRQHLEYRQCGDVQVATMGPSDTVRSVCIHFTRHLRGFLATSSPLWLCDVGMLVERYRNELDWDRVLGPDDKQRQWVLVALSLARDVLGMDPSNMPTVAQGFFLPTWSHTALFQQWIDPVLSPKVEMLQRGVVGGLKRMWPNPLTATLAIDASFGESPELRHQLHTYLKRMALYTLADLPRHKWGPRLGFSVDSWLVDG